LIIYILNLLFGALSYRFIGRCIRSNIYGYL